jgi:hypothetical protein
VTVKATAIMRLAAADVFYFGNLVGDTGDAAPGDLRAAVTSRDVVNTRKAGLSRRGAAVTNLFDHNRDGRVDIRDTVVARFRRAPVLELITAPA